MSMLVEEKKYISVENYNVILWISEASPLHWQWSLACYVSIIQTGSSILLVPPNIWLQLSKLMFPITSNSFDFKTLRTNTASEPPWEESYKSSSVARWQPDTRDLNLESISSNKKGSSRLSEPAGNINWTLTRKGPLQKQMASSGEQFSQVMDQDLHL